MNKLWLDDRRDPPNLWEGWHVARTVEAAMDYFAKNQHVHVVSFDHDLGGDNTAIPFMQWLCKFNLMPDLVLIHSSNAPGCKNLASYVQSFNKVRKFNKAQKKDVLVIMYDYMFTLGDEPFYSEEALLVSVLPRKVGNKP